MNAIFNNLEYFEQTYDLDLFVFLHIKLFHCLLIDENDDSFSCFINNSYYEVDRMAKLDVER